MVKFTKWEKDWLLMEFEREYEIHDRDNFLNDIEADKYLARVQALEQKVKQLEVEEE